MPRVARPTGVRIARSTSQSRATSPARSLLCSFPILMPSFGSLFLLLLARDTTGYWQQQVAYRITASLNEQTGVLTGRERISYVNRSSATLRDFYVHQYLNAFRPGSRWAAADAAEDRDRFQHLGEPDYAFERITAATLGGRELRPDYPYAPDSTVAHWSLARALVPGAASRRGAQVRPLPGRARASLCVLAQPAVPLRAGPLRRRGGARVVSARGPRHVGERRRRPQYDHCPRLARLAVRRLPVAAAHQRAPHRGGRHRVPHDDHGRQRGARPDRARSRPPVHYGAAREQRVARGLARRGVHQLPDGLVLRVARRAAGVRRGRT